jgi:leucyl aminopeptidase
MSAAPDVKLTKAVPAGATAVAVPVFSDRLGKVDGVRRPTMQRAGFGGKAGETLVLNDGERVRVLLGLGPSGESGPTGWRRAAADFARCTGRHRRTAFEFPSELVAEGGGDVLQAVAEGLVLGAYRFDTYRSADDRPTTDGCSLVVGDSARRLRPLVERGVAIAAAVCFARDLVNEPGGSLTPRVFAERAAERAGEVGLGVEVMDEQAIAEAGLGGLLAVNQGSTEPPRLLKLTYDPPAGFEDAGPDADAAEVPTVALVGKGITFDSGGLSIKPADAMMGMKSDMAGAAAVIAAMTALPAVGAPVRVVAFTPMTDNMTGGSAQRPGDVYTARNGTTVEVLNTDAEGRLVLADALVLAAEEAPDAIIDLATLTGACMVALGDRIAGLMGNDDAFVATVSAAAARVGERVWHLPLPPEYRSQLDSTVADLKNIGAGRYGGALTAGLFLREFVPAEVPWVHLDIAGPAFGAEQDGENPKGGTGFGVRTLVELLQGWGGDGSAADAPDVAGPGVHEHDGG